AFYNFEQLRPSASGHYAETDLNRVLSKAKRASARIIEQVLSLTEQRQGVMIFAATTDHAREIMGYLPPDCSAMVLGDMKAKARDSVINGFKTKQIKYLVNVAVLTTGFDAPHVDTIVILRPTESVGLYQQIVGRGLRLSPGKQDCLVLDYAGNRHSLFAPEVGEPKPKGDSEQIIIPCPECGF
ncbi:MAG: helicase-related protein, partial [Cellvibrionaceae bacterium]|nr:helicase-related protein [Cellvibrionaceae bacterium]